MATASAARSYLSFTPREPRQLGYPRRIFVQTFGGETERRYRGVIFIYDTDQYGLIHVNMLIDGLSEQQSHAHALTAVERSKDPTVRGKAEIVTIRGGTEALIGYPPDESRVIISWGEGEILVLVTGPTLTRDQALAIAEKV